MLTRLDGESPLPQIRTAATLSPLLIEALLRRDGSVLGAVLDQWQAPVHAVPLCRSLGTEGTGPRLNAKDADAIALIGRAPELLRSRFTHP